MRGQMESKDHPVTRVPDSELDYDEELTYRWRGELFSGVGFDDSPSGLSAGGAVVCGAPPVPPPIVRHAS